MRILIDMDDTLEHLSDAWVALLNKKYGFDVKREDIDNWDIASFFPGLDRKQVFEPLHTDDFWQTVEPFEDASDVLQQMIEDGHDIYIVTSSHYQGLKGKLENALFRFYPFISRKNVIVTYNKQMIRGDVLIDDGVHNLIGGDYYKILMDAPYNRAFDAENNGMIRVKDWKEVYEAIEVLKKMTEAKEAPRNFHGIGVNTCKKKIRNDIFGEENDDR